MAITPAGGNRPSASSFESADVPVSLASNVAKAALQQPMVSSVGVDRQIVATGEKTWFEWAASCAAGVGQTAASYLAPVCAAVSGVARDYIFQPVYDKATSVVTGYVESGAAAESAAYAVTRLLPPNDHYSAAIAEAQVQLDEVAGSSVPKEACHALSLFLGDYLDQYLLHPEEIETKELRLSALEGLIYEDESGVHHTFLGQVLTNVAVNNKGLLQQTVEINLLKVMTSLLTTIKKLQEEKPYFLVDLLKDVMEETAAELDHIRKGDQDNVEINIEEDELLYKNLSKALLKLCFPQGASDIELPLVGVASYATSMVQSHLYGYIETQVIPKMIGKGFNEISSEKTREKILLIGFGKLQKVFRKGEVSTKVPIFTRSPPEAPYERQDEFNKSFGAMVSAFVHYVDPSTYRLMKALRVTQKIEKQAAKVSEKLVKLDLVAAMSLGLEKGVKGLVPEGSWSVNEDKMKVFEYRRPHFVITKAETEKKREKKEALDEERKEKLDSVVTHFADDLDGLIDKAVGKAKLSAEDQKRLRHKFRRGVSAAIRGCKKGLLKLFMTLVGKKVIKKKGARTRAHIDEISLPRAGRALHTFAAKKMSR